jgi:two-component system response regulator AtoC
VEYDKPTVDLSDTVARLCWGYEWPGNVRQLENMMKRRVVLDSEESLLTELQQPVAVFPHRAHASTSSVPHQALATAVPMGETAADPPATPTTEGQVSLKDISRTASRGAEGEMILRALTRTHWNRKEAAGILGISYKALLYKIKGSGLDKAS